MPEELGNDPPQNSNNTPPVHTGRGGRILPVVSENKAISLINIPEIPAQVKVEIPVKILVKKQKNNAVTVVSTKKLKKEKIISEPKLATKQIENLPTKISLTASAGDSGISISYRSIVKSIGSFFSDIFSLAKKLIKL